MTVQFRGKQTGDEIAKLAGQLGGTAASPDVRGIRETGGPTLLALGSVADGQYLKRSGSGVVGASALACSGTATITVGTVAPGSPATGDLWVDTN